MMKSNFSKLTVLACCVSIFVTPPSYADLSDDLDSMLSSAGSFHFTSAAAVTPDSLTNSLRPGIDLGRIRVRVNHSAPTLASFSTPSVDSSCSSFDLIGGTFSMMSLDELVEMIRNIATGTLTYALGQSIRALCPPCWSMMKSLEDTISQWNQSLKSSCEYSEQMGQTIANSFASARCNLLGNSGFDADTYECQNEEASDSDESRDKDAEIDQITWGNVVYEALKDEVSASSLDWFPWADELFGNSSISDMDIVLSLIDTRINLGTILSTKKAVLNANDLDRLLIGEDEITDSKIILNSCSSDSSATQTASNGTSYSCLEYTSLTNSDSITPLSLTIKQIVADDMDASTETSIYEIFIEANATGSFPTSSLSDAQIKLINGVGKEMAAAMLFATNPENVGNENYFNIIAEVVGYDLAIEWNSNMVKVLASLPTQLADEQLPDEFEQSLANTRSDFTNAIKSLRKDRTESIKQLVDNDAFQRAWKNYNSSDEKSKAMITGGL